MISTENLMYFTAGMVFAAVCAIAADSKKELRDLLRRGLDNYKESETSEEMEKFREKFEELSRKLESKGYVRNFLFNQKLEREIKIFYEKSYMYR